MRRTHSRSRLQRHGRDKHGWNSTEHGRDKHAQSTGPTSTVHAKSPPNTFGARFFALLFRNL